MPDSGLLRRPLRVEPGVGDRVFVPSCLRGKTLSWFRVFVA